MAKTLTNLASFLRPLGGGTDDLVAIKLHRRAITVAEVRQNSNVINIDNIASAPLPCDLQITGIQRQHDMVADTLRAMREQGLFSAPDAGIIIPSGVITLRQVNLPYLTASEMAKESKDPEFWAEIEPEIAKLDDPFITYHTLLSSENDDITRVVLGFAEMATLRPWVDVLLSAHLNPTYIELEPIALANYLYASLPPDERKQSQVILHASADRIEIVAFQPFRFHAMKLEISDFDQILLAEIEDVDDPVGDFWDEVGGRISNTLKQAILFLQEEQDFPPFSIIHVATDSLRARNFMKLLDQHFSIAPLVLWDPTDAAQLALPVQQLLGNVQNKSGFASTLGLALRKLGTYGEKGAGLIQLSMLPQAATLRQNRQIGVISGSLVKGLVAVMLIVGGWTGGVVMPSFLSSQADSRGYENIKFEAESSQQRIESMMQKTQALQLELANLEDVGSAQGKSTILNTIPDLIPDGVELSAYSVSQPVPSEEEAAPENSFTGSVVTLKGSARNPQAVIQFVTELLNSGLIVGANASEPVLREDGTFFDFEITGQLQQGS